MRNALLLFSKKNLWLIFAVIGVLGFFLVWFVMPHKAEIDTVFQLIGKLMIFFMLTLSIAFFPNKFKQGYLLLLIVLLGFVCYIIPKISYYGYVGFPQLIDNIAGEFYTILYLILYPGIILSVCFSYRLGGGTPGNCIKLSLSGVLFIFSGLLDIMWLLINPVALPAVLEKAHHIEIILNHYPSFAETVVFALFHIPFLIIVLLLPLDKWIDKLSARVNRMLHQDTAAAK